MYYLKTSGYVQHEVAVLTGHPERCEQNIADFTFLLTLITASQSFYQSAKASFGKVGRIESEEVVLELVAEVCPNTEYHMNWNAIHHC